MSNEDVADVVAGFYGKLPSKGDFVRRNLPSSLVEACDAWLQGSIVASRNALGDRWLDAYLRSPIWRFVVSPECIDAQGWCGAIMPSVDRVNRYFPLLIACPARFDSNSFRLKTQNDAFYDECERLLITALDDDDLDIEEFTAQVAELQLIESSETDSLVLDSANAFPDVVLADGLSAEMNVLLLEYLCRQRTAHCSLWWSAVEDERQRLFLFDGMPDPGRYSALLTGTLDAVEGAVDEASV